MLSGTNLGGGGSWNDVLWLSSYTGSDVKNSYALIFNKYADEIGFTRQTYDATAWGTYRYLIHSGNIGSQSVGNADTVDSIHGTSFLRSDANDTFTGKLSVGSTGTRQAGMYGIYDSYKIGHIWSMGTAYVIPQDGSDFGNLYGLAYKHTNNTTGGTMAGGHQMVWVTNGTPEAAMGDSGIWTSGYLNAGTGNFSGGISATTGTFSGSVTVGTVTNPDHAATKSYVISVCYQR